MHRIAGRCSRYKLQYDTFWRSITQRSLGRDTLMEQIPFSKDFLFRQLFDPTSCTYTYMLADIGTREAVIIDPVIDWAKRDASIIEDLGLKLKFV
ncbi:persulfide dioxygenase ETHE1, mitochondrial-like, partial [Orussus abietinus]|uniref:persulfide dioxygenase ETHE1, mitochondrial-like n=1 Tax=Orussus abietinus TaxID=222816 RepID=UPI000C715D88